MAYMTHLLAAGSGTCRAPAIKTLLLLALLPQGLGSTSNDLDRPVASTLVQEGTASHLQLREASCVSAQDRPSPLGSTEGQDAVQQELEEVSLMHLGAFLTRSASRQQPPAAAAPSPGAAASVVSPLDARRPLAVLPQVDVRLLKVSVPVVTAPSPLASLSQLTAMKRMADPRTILWSPASKWRQKFLDVGPWLNSLPSTHRWHKLHTHKNLSRGIKHHFYVLNFITSVAFFEWFILALALICFLLLYRRIINWPNADGFHGFTLLIWLSAAGLYNTVIWLRLGKEKGTDWLIGYVMELIFSIENIFIYHIIIKSFRLPKALAQKALVIVVCCQIPFQMLFFMGLASYLASVPALPYVLGAWLIYVGLATLWEPDDEDTDESSAEEKLPWVGSWFQRVLGRRFVPYYPEDGSTFQCDAQIGLRCTLLAPTIICILLVDFCMEIDVTLTKIERIPNHFIAFSSSAAAAFAVPELFFIARDLFERFFLLKYGVTFVLIFFGLQLLLGNWLQVSDTLGILVIVAVMAVCMLLSATLYRHRPMASGLNASASASSGAFEASPARNRGQQVLAEVWRARPGAAGAT